MGKKNKGLIETLGKNFSLRFYLRTFYVVKNKEKKSSV